MARARMGADAIVILKVSKRLAINRMAWDIKLYPETLKYMNMCNMLLWHGPQLVNYIHITPWTVFSAMCTINERCNLDAWRSSSVMSAKLFVNISFFLKFITL